MKTMSALGCAILLLIALGCSSPPASQEAPAPASDPPQVTDDASQINSIDFETGEVPEGSAVDDSADKAEEEESTETESDEGEEEAD